MSIIGDIFNQLFLAPVFNILVIILQSLESLGVPGALGVAIIILTILVRLVTWPLMGQQLRSAKMMLDLKPHLDELKKKHDKDRNAYAVAQAKLFKDHGYNPAAGCLPTLIQIPVIIALYQSISSLFNGDAGLAHINYFLYPVVEKLSSAPNPYFLGFNLASKPADFGTVGWVVLLVPVVTGLLQMIQSKMMTPVPVKVYPNDIPKEKKEKAKEEDAMAAVQTQMTYLLPLMIGYFAYNFPIGLAIYWNMFSILGIYQQYQVSGWGGLKPWLQKIKLSA